MNTRSREKTITLTSTVAAICVWASSSAWAKDWLSILWALTFLFLAMVNTLDALTMWIEMRRERAAKSTDNEGMT